MKNFGLILITLILSINSIEAQVQTLDVGEFATEISNFDKKFELVIPNNLIIPEFPTGLIYQDINAGNGFANLSEDLLRISDYPVGFQFTVNAPTFSELTKDQLSFFEANAGGSRIMAEMKKITNEGQIVLYDYNNATIGTLGFTAGGVLGVSTVSDRALKENISVEKDVLSRILKIQLKTYNYIGSETRSRGFIAQEVEEVFPELVGEVNGKKTVNYSGFSTLAIQAIHEQQDIIEDLTERIKKLEEKIN